MSRGVALPITIIVHVQQVAAEAIHTGSRGQVRVIMEWNS